MSRHVDFQGHLNAAECAVLLDLLEGVRGIGEAGRVGGGLGEEGQGRDLQRPGLGVCGVEVEAVEFVPGEGVDGALDVRGGVVGAGDVEVEAAVGEFGGVGYGDGG